LYFVNFQVVKRSLIVLPLLFVLALFSGYRLSALSVFSGDLFYLAPPPLIEHFAFGFSDPMADFIWIRSIQDFDYCEKKIDNGNCKNNSWISKMLESATDLSPYLRMAYALGAVSLSVLVSDVEGARKLFEKGMQYYPTDWKIAYRAAYHYIYEVKNKERAAELLVIAGKNGAPQWVFSLATKLFNESGKRELGEALLKELEESGIDESILEKMRQRIRGEDKK
jgi:hypothetical protein